MKPLRFYPYYKPVVWGGSSIGAFKRIAMPYPNIGESWEISGCEGHESIVAGGDYDGKTITEVISEHGEDLMGAPSLLKFGNRFPLLLKIIDARRNLSVQVHPNDEEARRKGLPYGKTELWYILNSRPHSSIYAGFKHAQTHDSLRKHIADYTLMDEVENWSCINGDVFYIPAGQIHAIGEGNLLLEIQQASDVTYRLFDYGRIDATGHQRQLHIDDGLSALSLDIHPQLKFATGGHATESSVRDLCQCEYFTVTEINIKESFDYVNNRDSFMILFCVNGEIIINDDNNHHEILHKGETILYPASCRLLKLTGNGRLLAFTI